MEIPGRRITYRVLRKFEDIIQKETKCSIKHLDIIIYCYSNLESMAYTTLSNVDDGETVPTPVTTVLSLQNLMDANKFLVLSNVI